MTSRRVTIATIALLALVSVGTASAQDATATRAASDSIDLAFDREWPQPSTPLARCVAAMPLEEMKRTSVYLRAIIADSTRTTLTAQTDLMAQQVSELMRTEMGGAVDSLPNGDGMVNAWGVPSELVVVAHSDGSIRRYGKSSTLDTSATTLLGKAFDAARARGDALVVWPDGYSADSLVVRLLMEPAPLKPDGSMLIVHYAQPEFGVFRIPEPILTPALAKRGNPPPRYPTPDHIHRVQGYILLQFVVDTSGRAEPRTIRDLWPEKKPRLTGELLRYYESFVDAAKEVLPSWRFYPARLGSCRVPQIVQLPIAYEYRPQ